MTHKISINNDNIIFLDLEVSKKTKKIYELGMVYKSFSHNTPAIKETKNFIKLCNARFICGHNFIDFDLEVIKDTSLYNIFKSYKIIDTLPVSLLLFNEKSVHSLPKSYKSEDDFKNDPVEDSKITAQLLDKLEKRFFDLESQMQNVFYSLLKEEKYFCGFFDYLSERNTFEYLKYDKLYEYITVNYSELIVNKEYLRKVIKLNPMELGYILALLTPHIEIKSHPPKILHTHKNIVSIQKELCFDIDKSKEELSCFAKEVFGFGTFRPFPKLNPTLEETAISQRDIIEASLNDESFLAILPTGGGKTFTFWLPAIIKAKAYKSLTVVISPLQALIEDHITSFNSKVANYKAVAISGYMSPLERSEAIEQVINGEADILYLAPESLRSNAIFNILKNRLIERFVIDEAHCLSTWGNDFRQDYYYICDYVKDLLEAKNFQDHIPISCFTATAKPSVIDDIKVFFANGLNIQLDDYIATPERKNLRYKSIPSEKKEKYPELLRLIKDHDGATLVYIPSSTKDCDKVAEQLTMDTEKSVKSFHSKIDSQEKMKILKGYILSEIDVIVATTAFGMGVDKADITNVIHYEMSDSLESYTQEAGRGARDERLEAFCPILYDEDDLDKHFASLNRSKITASEINSIFRVLKRTKGDIITKTAFEIALEAGWDVEDESSDYASKIKTALLELEREGYISRKRNKTNFFADSVAESSMYKLHSFLETSNLNDEEKQRLILVLQTILGKVKSVQVDEIAHLLGYKKSDISLAIQELKEMEILGNSKDLSLQIKKNTIKKFITIQKIESKLLIYLEGLSATQVTIKELNEHLHQEGLISKNESTLIKSLIRNWRDKSLFLFKRINRQNDLWYFKIIDKEEMEKTVKINHSIAYKILDVFIKSFESDEKEKTIDFSLKNLRHQIGKEYTIKEIDKALLYLHHLHVLELLNGMFISYSPMQISKEEKVYSKRKYTQKEYDNRLAKHYQVKIESIHIMGEYAKRLQSDDYKAGMFLKDYFILPYNDFKKKYNLLKEKISRPITQRRYNKIFSEMSDEQKEIISDKQTKAMMILAGPGSGKTKVLVHKIASLILTEDIKPEQFMMLTFSRTAAGEFRSRLNKLIGVLSYDIEINTFHAYALNLIARTTKEDNNILDQSISEATKQINDGDITLPYKRVLVLDEFQDINENSFELVKAIYNASNQEIKIIAVGDDDQCVMTHAGADVKFIDKFSEEFGKDDEGKDLYKQYELLTNFRSKRNIVNYSNEFIEKVATRYKQNSLHAHSSEAGVVTVQTCSSTNLITPAIQKVQEYADLKNIAILAYTNDEVMQLYSHLDALGIGAKYILERENFALKNISEVIEFDKTINGLLKYDTFYTEENFEDAWRIIESKFKGSKNLIILQKIIDRFLLESQNYYVSQWLAYLDEIKLEEFEDYNKTVTVSTIHKSKGMEFDNVIVLVNEKPTTDDDIRLYYVGMTRTKNELSILRHDTNSLNRDGGTNYVFDDRIYPENEKLVTLIMGLGDIQLGFHNENSNEILAGESIGFEMRGNAKTFCIIYKNRVIGFLSKAFHKKLQEYMNKGFFLHNVFVEFVVVWHDKEKGKNNKHPLCKIILKKDISVF
ncbi:MAG TPA: RecQ family ATP-dependent DNA helicase [Arcobacter sp.]|nr:RecQ family ATP-dependent DNA helicase [Arcobacter sp.]